MTLNQLIYFKEVAEKQHFTQAAENLYVAQSSISHSIIALEDELGVPLLIRKSGKRVELTEYGSELLKYANKILDNINDAEESIAKMKNPSGGVVNLSYSYFNCANLGPRAIAAFNKSDCSKDIVIRFVINHGLKKIEWELRDGDLDIAFTAVKKFEGLTSIPIATQKLYVYVSKDHPYSLKESVSMEEVATEPLIVYNQGRHMHSWIMKMFEDSGLSPNMVEFPDDWATEIAYVVLNEGIAIAPDLPYDQEYVNKIEIDHSMNTRTIYMHWPANRELSPATQTVVDFFKAYFQDLYGGDIPDYYFE